MNHRRRRRLAARQLPLRGQAAAGPRFRALLNEGSGLPTSDDGTTATLNTTGGVNSIGWTENGPFGAAPRFDHAGVADTGSFQFDVPDMTGFGEWTVTKWLKADTATASRWPGTVVTIGANDNRIVGVYPYDWNNGFWTAQADAGWDSDGFNGLLPASQRGAWHHWACSYTEAGQAFIVHYDGELLDTSTPSNTTRASADISAVVFNRVHIPGRWDAQEGIVGSVQDYRLYDRVLSTSEVQAIYALGA